MAEYLGLDLGILFDFEDHGERVSQSFESATVLCEWDWFWCGGEKVTRLWDSEDAKAVK